MDGKWFIVDAHEDLACHCQELRRDPVDPGDVDCMLTLPGLVQAGVRLICATFFVPHEGSYEERRAKLETQYEMYAGWLSQYRGSLSLVEDRAGLDALRAAPQGEHFGVEGYPVGVMFLMEGCDLLDSPADLETWHARGLRLASLTWNGTNRYASGCFGDYSGLSGQGRELLSEFRRLGLALDLSHLTDKGVEEALACFDGYVCATHSNSRRLCRHERNLTDDQALEIGRRDGVIGLNLLASFVRFGWEAGLPLPGIEEALAHTRHFGDLCGWQHVGLGSDLDGGLTRHNTPSGIDSARDLPRLCSALRDSGLSGSEVQGFAGANWLRFFERVLA